MVSRATALIEAEGVSYVQAWSSTRLRLFDQMERVRDVLSTVENRVMRLLGKRFYPEDIASADLLASMLDSVREFIPATVKLVDELDIKVTAVLALKFDCKHALMEMYRQFAVLLVKDGSPETAPALGWSAALTITRWMKDRKIKSEHLGMMARASRQSFLSRCRADNSHRAIIKYHRVVDADSRKPSYFSR